MQTPLTRTQNADAVDSDANADAVASEANDQGDGTVNADATAPDANDQDDESESESDEHAWLRGAEYSDEESDQENYMTIRFCRRWLAAAKLLQERGEFHSIGARPHPRPASD